MRSDELIEKLQAAYDAGKDVIFVETTDKTNRNTLKWRGIPELIQYIKDNKKDFDKYDLIETLEG